MDDKTKQNLIDAGCSEDFIQRFDECADNETKCEKLLAAHRRKLLDEVHAKEKNISCLDYLVFMMKKNSSQ